MDNVQNSSKLNYIGCTYQQLFNNTIMSHDITVAEKYIKLMNITLKTKIFPVITPYFTLLAATKK